MPELTQLCEVDVFEGYPSCELKAQVMYIPIDDKDAQIPLCLSHAKELARKQYDEGDASDG